MFDEREKKKKGNKEMRSWIKERVSSGRNEAVSWKRRRRKRRREEKKFGVGNKNSRGKLLGGVKTRTGGGNEECLGE